jgi:hypothetical protein
MTHQTTDNIKKQIEQIAVLQGSYNRQEYDQWHRTTQLLLESIPGINKDHTRDFSRLDGHASVFVMEDSPQAKRENEAENRAAYFRHLNSAYSLLNAIVAYQTMMSPESKSRRPERKQSKQVSKRQQTQALPVQASKWHQKGWVRWTLGAITAVLTAVIAGAILKWLGLV